MKSPNRDLLVLVKHALENQEAMEMEVSQLHSLLLAIEKPATFSAVYEVIDCNKMKIFSSLKKIMQSISCEDSAFVFLNNKN